MHRKLSTTRTNSVFIAVAFLKRAPPPSCPELAQPNELGTHIDCCCRGASGSQVSRGATSSAIYAYSCCDQRALAESCRHCCAKRLAQTAVGLPASGNGHMTAMKTPLSSSLQATAEQPTGRTTNRLTGRAGVGSLPGWLPTLVPAWLARPQRSMACLEQALECRRRRPYKPSTSVP